MVRGLEEHKGQRAALTQQIDDDEDGPSGPPSPAVRQGHAPCFLITGLLGALSLLAFLAVSMVASAFSGGAHALPASAGNFSASVAAQRLIRWETETDGKVWIARPRTISTGKQMMWQDVLQALAAGALGGELSATLRTSPHAAFFWETPPLSFDAARVTPFEMVTIDAPHLDVAPNPAPFSAALERCAGQHAAVAFPNLGGDATLVAPCAPDPNAAYSSLAHFLRAAPTEQVDALWVSVGRALQTRIREQRGDSPTWVSTEGSGVAWLHVRLDSTPKYYHHLPYRTWTAQGRRSGRVAAGDAAVRT